MKLTALELRNRSFGTRFKGYDPSEVEEFLEAAAARVEQLTRENLRLTEQLGESRARAEELRARENQVNDVLVTVRKASDDAAAVTQREGAAYLHEARLEGERLIVEARERRLRLAAEVETLRLLKERLHAEVQAVVDVQQSLLDGMLSATDEDNVTIRVEAPRRRCRSPLRPPSASMICPTRRWSRSTSPISTYPSSTRSPSTSRARRATVARATASTARPERGQPASRQRGEHTASAGHPQGGPGGHPRLSR
jgi:cell division initiation protein